MFLPLDNVYQSFSVSTMVQLTRSRGLINMFFSILRLSGLAPGLNSHFVFFQLFYCYECRLRNICKTHVLFYFYNETRSSHQRCCIKAVLKNCAIFTRKNLCWILFLVKLQAFRAAILLKKTATQVFSCEYCKIFKNTSFEEHLRTAASDETFIIRNR